MRETFTPSPLCHIIVADEVLKKRGSLSVIYHRKSQFHKYNSAYHVYHDMWLSVVLIRQQRCIKIDSNISKVKSSLSHRTFIASHVQATKIPCQVRGNDGSSIQMCTEIIIINPSSHINCRKTAGELFEYFTFEYFTTNIGSDLIKSSQKCNICKMGRNIYRGFVKQRSNIKLQIVYQKSSAFDQRCL